MLLRFLSGCLLAGCLFLSVPLYGQTIERHESEEVQSLGPVGPIPPQKADLAEAARSIIASTNHFRADLGRRELKVHPELTRSAQSFADFMARTDKYGHEADGHTPGQRVKKAGYRYCIAAENIAWDYNSGGFTTAALAKGLFEGWKHSPPHRRNILDPDLTEFGVGVAFSTRTGRYYAVQDFGRPRSKAITFKVANDTDTTVRYTVGGRPYRLPPRYILTHEVCRPPAVEFQGVSGPGSSAGEETVHPRGGAQYVIRKDESGRLTVTKR